MELLVVTPHLIKVVRSSELVRRSPAYMLHGVRTTSQEHGFNNSNEACNTTKDGSVSVLCSIYYLHSI